MRTYICIVVNRSPLDEAVQAVACTFQPLGILDEEAAWSCYFDGDTWSQELESAFTEAVRRVDPSVEFSVSTLPAANWNADWERSIEPVRISNRIVVTPSWRSAGSVTGEIVLTIDPKMSFGTGFHETTRVMIRLLERTVTGNERVLDVGTGTGILAIAAVKLGASSAVGVDTDEWSQDNARENCERNGVANLIRTLPGSVEAAEGMFDLILSNITRNDNLALLGTYAARLRPGGSMLLSGFYTTEEEAMNAASRESGFILIDAERENEWSALRFARS